MKLGEFGKIDRDEARWVVQGFRQRKGMDCDETYSQVVEGFTIHTLFAVAAAKE
jgi:hypothetical protein